MKQKLKLLLGEDSENDGFLPSGWERWGDAIGAIGERERNEDIYLYADTAEWKSRGRKGTVGFFGPGGAR